jgi:hypothetical protein
MERTGENPQAAKLQELAHGLAELRAELLVTQAALAGAMAEIARLTRDPSVALGEATARALGFAEAAARGLEAGGGRPQSVTAAADRFAGWAEAFLRNAR